MSEYSDEIRRSFQAADDIRDAGLRTPDDVLRYDDICYGEDKQWQVLDVYTPCYRDYKPLPVIVSVHGGGWVYGDKERYQYYCMSLAEHGFAVINFTYRLAPEFKFPAPLEDTNLVMEWVMDHAEEYGLDTKNIFAVGDSAGANILGLYAAICTNPDYADIYGFRIPANFSLAGVALNCGCYQFELRKNDGTSKLIKDFMPEKGTSKEVEVLNVVKQVTPAFPPTVIMTSTGDFLKPQAFPLLAKLAACDVRHEFQFYGSSTQELGHVFHCDMRSKEAALCNKRQCDFFKMLMRD